MEANTVVLSLDAYHELLECKHLVEEKYDVTDWFYGPHQLKVRHIKGDEVIKELKEINIELNKENDKLYEQVKKQKSYFSFFK